MRSGLLSVRLIVAAMLLILVVSYFVLEDLFDDDMVFITVGFAILFCIGWRQREAFCFASTIITCAPCVGDTWGIGEMSLAASPFPFCLFLPHTISSFSFVSDSRSDVCAA